MWRCDDCVGYELSDLMRPSKSEVYQMMREHGWDFEAINEKFEASGFENPQYNYELITRFNRYLLFLAKSGYSLTTCLGYLLEDYFTPIELMDVLQTNIVNILEREADLIYYDRSKGDS